MKWLRAILIALWTPVAGMIGGQKEKGVRRYGIPGMAVVSFGVHAIPMLLLIPVLSLGYGENSWLMDKIGSDTLVRIAYGGMLAIPFFFYGAKRFLFALLVLPLAFSIHAGKLGTISSFDFLVEDIIRYTTLGVLMAYSLFKKNT